MEASKKIAHEEFVSHLTGSPLWETFTTISVPGISLCLRNIIVTVYPQSNQNLYRKHLLDLIFILLGSILPVTLLSNHTIECSVVLALVASLLIIRKAKELFNFKLQPGPDCVLNYQTVPNRALFFSELRGLLMVFTSVCILAVDFHAYPRRFAKTETYGSGIMDVGVASFVFSMGTLTGASKFGRSVRWRSLKSITPLIVIGGLRTLSVKSIEYQEHVTEYGVHWNFFISLAVIKLASFPINKLCPLPYWCLAVCITSLHQLGLYLGLENYVVEGGDRTASLIYANREGFVSLGGYLGIFYWGAHLGELVAVFMEENNSTKKKSVENSYNCLKKLCVHLLLIIIASMIACCMNLPVSRRLTNFAYIMWSISFCTFLILGLMLGDAIIKKMAYSLQTKGYSPSYVLVLVNEEAMTYFLVSNLLTGAINLVFDTLAYDDVSAVLILIGYQTVAIGITHCKAVIMK